MPAKRSAASRRARLPRECDHAKQFRRDWEQLSRAGRRDMYSLKAAMLLLVANDGPLEAEWGDHPLKGEMADYRECHIGGDFLLIYRESDDHVTFVRAGSHAELFED